MEILSAVLDLFETGIIIYCFWHVYNWRDTEKKGRK